MHGGDDMSADRRWMRSGGKGRAHLLRPNELRAYCGLNIGWGVFVSASEVESVNRCLHCERVDDAVRAALASHPAGSAR